MSLFKALSHTELNYSTHLIDFWPQFVYLYKPNVQWCDIMHDITDTDTSRYCIRFMIRCIFFDLRSSYAIFWAPWYLLHSEIVWKTLMFSKLKRLITYIRIGSTSCGVTMHTCKQATLFLLHKNKHAKYLNSVFFGGRGRGEEASLTCNLANRSGSSSEKKTTGVFLEVTPCSLVQSCQHFCEYAGIS